MGDDGNVSEWNEGNLKSKRLHELQERINYLLTYPLEHNGQRFNFEEAFPVIIALFTEGRSKYTQKEQDEIEEFEGLIEYTQIKYPAYKVILINKFGNQSKKFQMDNVNYTMIFNMIKKLHRKVLQYHDDHGLSTRNKDEFGGLF